MSPSFTLRVGAGCTRPEIEEGTLFLTVPDIRGTYTLPYIQSEPDLEVEAEADDGRVAEVRLSLCRPGLEVRCESATPERPRARFIGLPPGEYVLDAVALDARGREVGRMRLRRIGVGTTIAALGDSITEGYRGVGFHRGEHLDPTLFPAEAVSRDRRNFPQFSPTTHHHLPSVDCFQSWMTGLNDLLSDSWGHPVFIANEGWGGYKTADYLRMMRGDAGWQGRMRLLRPRLWLIHLGVNDERAHLAAEDVERNLEGIVAELVARYGAAPEHIFLARPCYDYAEGAPEILRGYCRSIDALAERLGLSAGPDFFEAYSRDKERWYGADPVHPNTAGMRRMAQLWHESILGPRWRKGNAEGRRNGGGARW